MTRDIAGGAGALGVHGTSELGAFFERKVAGDHVGLNRGCRTDVDAVSSDVSLEIPIHGHFAGCHRGMHARSRACDKTMAFQIDGPFEQPSIITSSLAVSSPFIVSAVPLCMGSTFTQSSSFGQAERNHHMRQGSAIRGAGSGIRGAGSEQRRNWWRIGGEAGAGFCRASEWGRPPG